MRAGKGDAVLQGKEAVAAGFLVLDREADKIPRRLALPPVHREQRHAVAAMQLQREGRRRVRAADLKLTTSHPPPPCCACARTSVRIVPRSACNIAHIHVRRYADLPRSTAASGGDGRSHWMGSRGWLPPNPRGSLERRPSRSRHTRQERQRVPPHIPVWCRFGTLAGHPAESRIDPAVVAGVEDLDFRPESVCGFLPSSTSGLGTTTIARVIITAMRTAPGTRSRSNPSRFGTASLTKKLIP